MKEFLQKISGVAARQNYLQFILGALSSPLIVILFFSPEQQHQLMVETQKIAQNIEELIGSAKVILGIVTPVISLWIARIAGGSETVQEMMKTILQKKPDTIIVTDGATAAQVTSPNAIPAEQVKAVLASPEVVASVQSHKVIPG